MSAPSFEQLIPNDTTTILKIKTAATMKGYELLQLINLLLEFKIIFIFAKQHIRYFEIFIVLFF